MPIEIKDFLYGLARMTEIMIGDTEWEYMTFRNREKLKCGSGTKLAKDLGLKG
jgi:hypothetical protein